MIHRSMTFAAIVMTWSVAAWAEPITGEIEVAPAQRSDAMHATITGDAAKSLYEHLAIEPRIEQNVWSQDVLIKDGPGITCKRDFVQEGIVVRPVETCELNVSTRGAVRR